MLHFHMNEKIDRIRIIQLKYYLKKRNWNQNRNLNKWFYFYRSANINADKTYEIIKRFEFIRA